MKLGFTGYSEATQRAFFDSISASEVYASREFTDYDLCTGRGEGVLMRSPGAEAYDWGKPLTFESAYDLQWYPTGDTVAV